MKKCIFGFTTLMLMAALSGSYVKSLSTPVALSFFTGNAQNLYLSNNITITNGLYGVSAAANANATNYWYVGGLQSTNILAGSNTTVGVIPQMFAANRLWSDQNANVNTPAIAITINDTNVYLPNNDNNLFQSTNFFPLIFAPTAGSTNAITFTFRRGIGHMNYIQWDSLNQFSCTISNAGVGPLTIITNPPAAFYQGATWIQLYTVSSISSSGPGNIISRVQIGGFAP